MKSLFNIVIATILAVTLLYVYEQKKIVAEDFALGAENSHTFEKWKGENYTASSIKGISSFVNGHADPQKKNVVYILWLGNSQLHTINQYKQGDHLAPYWFRIGTPRPDRIVPLGFSLPNANFQEYLALNQFVTSKLPIRALILEAVFDDLREDDLRDDFAEILTPEIRKKISSSRIGNEVLSRFLQTKKSDDPRGNIGLEGFIQKGIEDEVTRGLEKIWPLWENRPNLRTYFLTDIYFLRNSIFGIKPTSVRKMIKPRYERNMQALETMLYNSRQENIPVVIYIAPIRQDHLLPYSIKEYGEWKDQLMKLANSYSATCLNLEKLVPSTLWGTYHESDIDFMHFQGEGHKLVAQALLPAFEKSVKE